MKAITTFFLAILSTNTYADVADHSNDPDVLLYRLGNEIERSWYRDETSAWKLGSYGQLDQPAPCTILLGKLRNLGVPKEATIELAKDTRDLPRGKHALPAVRRACDAIEYASKLANVEHAITLAVEYPENSAEGCSKQWPKAIAAGVRPTERIRKTVRPENGAPFEIDGTLEELKTKYCDDVKSAQQAAEEARLAPYRKVLKRDKLEIMLDYRSARGIILADGDRSKTPAKLAAARVWYAERSHRDDCNDGRRRVIVTRYDFDAKHALVKTTEKEYCGGAEYR